MPYLWKTTFNYPFSYGGLSIDIVAIIQVKVKQITYHTFLVEIALIPKPVLVFFFFNPSLCIRSSIMYLL